MTQKEYNERFGLTLDKLAAKRTELERLESEYLAARVSSSSISAAGGSKSFSSFQLESLRKRIVALRNEIADGEAMLGVRVDRAREIVPCYAEYDS